MQVRAECGRLWAFVEGVTRMRPIICPNPNCGYRGKPRRKARGSAIVAIVLLCIFVLPGLLYMIFMSGYRYYCPNCGLQVGNDN